MTGSTTSQPAGAHCATDSASTPSSGAVTSMTGSPERLELTIAGMSCGHCVRAVSKTLDALAGVEVDHVGIGHASLWFEPGTVSTAAVIEALRDAGYPAGFEPSTSTRTGNPAQAEAGLPQAPTGGSCCSSR